jgi:hypothetical protein
MPPDASTTSVPIANNETVVPECSKSKSVANWKKRGFNVPTTRHVTRINPSVNHSGLRINRAVKLSCRNGGATSANTGPGADAPRDV